MKPPARTRAVAAVTTLLVVGTIGVVHSIHSDADDAVHRNFPSQDVFTFGDARYQGSTGGLTLTHQMVGIARTPDGNGYLEAADDGGVFAFGDALFSGSMSGISLKQPIASIAITPSGRGYWLLGGDGKVFPFGDAQRFGSPAARHVQHLFVGMAPTPSGRGYWLVADNGAVYAYGDATTYGSTLGVRSVAPVMGIAATPSGRGYWLVADDGAVYAYGDAPFLGSAIASSRGRIIMGIAATRSGRGYWLTASDGAVYAYGDAPFRGSAGEVTLAGKSVVGIVGSPSGHGYWLVASRPPGTKPSSVALRPHTRPFVVPPSRRLTATFVRSTRGTDRLLVRYYEHGDRASRLYTCTKPRETRTNGAAGRAETWTSTGSCVADPAHHSAFAAKFATPRSGPPVLYVRVSYGPIVSYRFACVNPKSKMSRTATTSYRVHASRRECHVDQSTPETQACGGTQAPPRTYRHIVVVMEENRTWSEVGGPDFGDMPYAQELATQCASYRNWLDTNAVQDSLPQYIGLTSGVDNRAVWDDCVPSAKCRSTDDNIFRQVRDAGGTVRTFVEGATTGCNGATHPANVPALYYYGRNDHSFCTKEVRPLTEMNVNALPTFSMIIPTLCDNGHNCGNDVVDGWLRIKLRKLITGASYRSGTTAIFVLYDEDRPMPNLVIAPTAHRGEITNTVATHSDALRSFDEMLGLPILSSVRNVTSLRRSAHI